METNAPRPARGRSCGPSPARFAWFTLAELVVAVAVVAVLSALGLLSLMEYQRAAVDARAKTNVRSVLTAIAAEAASTAQSPRAFVVHDPAYAFSKGSVVVFDAVEASLSPGPYGDPGTNYSAGNPDYAKLRLDPDRFRVSGAVPGLLRALAPWLSAAAEGQEAASADFGQVLVGAADLPDGSRSASATSFVQTAGILSDSTAYVVGDYPTETESSLPGLIRDPAGSDPAAAFVDGEPTGPAAPPTYPGCDTPDIVLDNGQRWAACNVGATTAYVGGAGQPYPTPSTAPTAAQKAYLGAFFQWGRNEDVTDLGTTATLAAAGSTSSTVVGSFVTNSTSPYDWIATQNGNLWGGGSTSLGAGTFADRTEADRALMQGPCAAGYHVPTQAEWYSAISAINPALTNAATWQNDTTVRTALKLPLAGNRDRSAAAYNHQGTLGYYWASSPTGTSGGYIVYLSATQVIPAINSYRADGFSVRCVADQVLVTFAPNGAGVNVGFPNKSVIPGSPVWALPTADRPGHAFDGWFTEAAGGTRVTASTVVTADATWYARWSVVGTPAYYPGADGVAGTADDCDTADIVLANGQRWAACNVGATTAYVGQPYPSAAPTLAHKAYLGALYQWGRNEDVTALATTSTRAAAWSTSSTVLGRFVAYWSAPYDWIATQNGNLWGGAGTTAWGGVFGDREPADRALMRGPCAPGYHVPTAWEWYSAFKSADPEIKPGTAGWQNTALPRALRLPTGSGMRAVIGGTWWYPGTRGHYWASTTLGTDGYGLPVTSTQVYLYGDSARRGHGFSVRCIADEERADPLCGAAQGVAVPSAPTSLLCAVGTAAGMAEATESYSWTCSNGPGEPVSCSAPRQYAVTFAANGGWTPSPATKNVAYGTAVWTLATVSRTYHAFDGWFTSASGGTRVSTGAVVTEPVTYYAQWTALDASCGTAQGVARPSAPTSNLCAVGTAAGMAEATESYSWTCANDPAASAACSAPRQYAVTWNPNGAWAVASASSANVTYGAPVWPLPTADRPGHALDGWFTSPSGIVQIAEDTPVTGPTTYYARWSVVGTPSYYPGADGVAGTADDCDTPDIVLDNGQRWAACNVGATTAYVGGAGQPYPSATATRTAAQKAYMGAIFQWGRNDDVTAGPSNFVTKAPAGTSASGVGHSNFIRSSSSPYDWIATQNGNLWGGGSTSLGAGTFADRTEADRALMQGPCAAGYHVPTQAEWGTAIAAVPAPKFVTALRLPLSGYRYFSSANYAAQGTHGYYWTSSPTGTKGYAVVFTPTSVSSAITENRALGSSVRCVAD